MSRAGVVLLASAFAIASMPAPTDATTRGTSKTATSAKKKSASKKKKKRRTKAKRKRAAAKQLATKKQGMPDGFTWPPDKAMKVAGEACEANLDALGIKWKKTSREGKIIDAIVVPSMEIAGVKYVSAYKQPPHRMDCHLVQALAAVGPELVALGVREVKFGSIYRNTQVRAHGATKPILSRHALGLAMDIKSFTDAQGREASVELDYLRGDPLLHGIEDAINKSERFRIVLTPGNDPISHYDHFHIEATVDFTAFR